MVSDWVEVAIDLQRMWENGAKKTHVIVAEKNVGSQIYLYPNAGGKQDAIIKLTAMWQYYLKTKPLNIVKVDPVLGWCWLENHGILSCNKDSQITSCVGPLTHSHTINWSSLYP